MREPGKLWVIILAAGEGQRVRALTRLRPKQFCTVDGRRSMLRWSVDRALRLVPRERIVAVVAEQHRGLWDADLCDLPRRNVVVQPANRGTLSGVLLPFTEVLRRDPAGAVLVMPSDQYVRDEPALATALQEGVRLLRRHPGRVVLFGMRPSGFESCHDWILPSRPVAGERVRSVGLLLDDADDRIARRVMRQGGLMDSLIFAARTTTLLGLFESAATDMTEPFLRLDETGVDYEHALRAIYHALPTRDFRREILSRAGERLMVLPVDRCGWLDLATPGRLKIFRSRDHLLATSPAIGPPGSWFG